MSTGYSDAEIERSQARLAYILDEPLAGEVESAGEGIGEPAPSPFLPGTKLQFAWDSTSLGYLKTCPRLYQYIIIDGWTSAGESIHLRFGQEYHQALQEYDVSRANGISHEDAIHDVVAALVNRVWLWEVDRETKAGKYKNRDTLISLVVDYLDHFGPADPAQTYIKADGTPAVELSFQFELDWGPEAGKRMVFEDLGRPLNSSDIKVGGTSYIDPTTRNKLEPRTISQPYLLCGHLDRVVRFNDQLLVKDRKTTTTTLGQYYFAQWEPNNQMTLYTLAGRVILKDPTTGTPAPIRGVVIDAAQVLLEEPNRFVRGFTYRTEEQLVEWLNDLAILLRLNETYVEANYWPMNDTSCDKFGGCRFRDICSKSPQVRERFLKADFVQLPENERWNPLKSR